MKRSLKICISIILSIAIFAVSAFAVFYYSKPMEDKSYNLSLLSEDGQEWEGEKGWSVYTNQQGKRNELISDGTGGYNGLDYAGQTFYFSRNMTEQLDSPALRIGTVNRCVSVFLDDTLIYTDCPEADNRIGYLELPMLEYDKTEPVVVSLPHDYQGRTLTIAQSSPAYSEKPGYADTVYPCEVTLYCGYSYESELIADTSQTMIPAVLLFALEILLLIAFIWNSTSGNTNLELPTLALATFFQASGILAQAPFFYQYFNTLPIDPVWLSFHLSVGALLIFITIKSTKKLRLFFIIATILQWCAVALYCIVRCSSLVEYGDLYLFFSDLPQCIGFAAMIAVLVCSFLQWRKRNQFFRRFSQASIVITCGYLLFVAASFIFSPDYPKSVLERICSDFSNLLPNFTLKLMWNLCLFSAIAAIIFELVEKEAARRTENAVLSSRNELAMESYSNLCRQTEEIMILRHDTMKHYSLLHTMAKESPEKVSDYLEQLIGQMNEIRPIVQSGNQILDIIINGKLGISVEKGINVEIVRSQAPDKLPISDDRLCSLITNILDNAITAASSSAIEKPYIKLDFHCKNNNFIFSCENSMNPEECRYAKNSCLSKSDSELKQKTPVSSHGYGLKIIKRIMSNYNDMLSIAAEGNVFKLSIILPVE